MGSVRLSAERLDGPYGLVRLRLQVENASAWNDPAADRSVALRHALVAAHSLIGIDQGVFLSLLDPRSGPSRPPRPAATSTPGRS